MVYVQLASLYDRLMSHAPYEKWHSFTKRILKESAKPIEKIIDLGCGTGEITLRLAKEGYEMYGIDFSSQMLTQASHKAFEQGVNVHWLKQDIRNLSGLKNFDLAFSYCDVINYITSKEDLKKTFLNINNLLRPEGLFIFDVHSMNYVEDVLKNNTFAEVDEDFSYIWFSDQGKEKGEIHHYLTFYVLEEEHGERYKRFDEYHYQKTYPIQVYEKLLLETGFEQPILYADFSVETEKSLENADRIFFLTQKKS